MSKSLEFIEIIKYLKFISLEIIVPIIVTGFAAPQISNNLKEKLDIKDKKVNLLIRFIVISAMLLFYFRLNRSGLEEMWCEIFSCEASVPSVSPAPIYVPNVKWTPFSGHTIQFSVERRVRECSNGSCINTIPVHQKNSIYITDDGVNVFYNDSDDPKGASQARIAELKIISPPGGNVKYQRIYDTDGQNLIMKTRIENIISDLGGEFVLSTKIFVAQGNGCFVKETLTVVSPTIQTMTPIIDQQVCHLVEGRHERW